MSHVLEGILRMPPALALALVFLLPAVEASIFVGVVVPGEIGVILGGVLANQHKLPLAAVFAAGIAGAIIGDSIGYWVGRRYGDALLTRLPDRLVDEDKIARTKDTIRRLGGKAVFVGRFTAALRAFVPGIAGLGRLRYRTFLLWNVLGGGCWATGYVLLGYLAGSQYKRIERYANYIGIGLLVIIAGYFLGRHLLRRRNDRSGHLPRTSGRTTREPAGPPGGRSHENYSRASDTRPMTTPRPARYIPLWVSAVLGVLAVLFLIASIIYFTRTAGHLPSFFPGHQTGSAHHHTKHGIALLALAVVCVLGIWFGTGRRSPQPAPES